MATASNLLASASLAALLASCATQPSQPSQAAQPEAQKELLLGGDVSMLPSYEKHGAVYRDSAGNAVDFLPFVKDNGWNAIRVRLFVNPSLAPAEHKGEGVCQDINYVLPLAKRIKEAGFRFMLDFHYSDTWADPGKQFIPAEWTNHSPEALADSVASHTRMALEALNAAGATPDLIQVGNEITNGTLWPVAKINHDGNDDWSILCRIVQSGAAVCREFCPDAKLILHTEKAGDWFITNSFYSAMRSHAVDYDVIGLSYYPMWHRNVGVLAATLDSLRVNYPDKEVMIVEAAGYYSHKNDPWAKPDQYSEFYPISPAGQAMYTKELVSELKRHDNVTGLFWWFPEENASGSNVTVGWLNRGLFDNETGRALPAFYEFAKYR